MPSLIDETGNKYGKLIVLERRSNPGGVAKWLCRCECGHQTVVFGTSLRNGKTRSCGQPTCGEIGKRYGRLVVVGLAETSKCGARQLLCRCDCGNTKAVSKTNLRNGGTRSCGCLQKEFNERFPLGHGAMTSLINRYKGHARRRNIEWELTREEVGKLTKMNCWYCGAEPAMVYKFPRGRGDYTYNGIDRVDNNKDYTLDNVVPCCNACNRAKLQMSYDEFLEWAHRLAIHQGWTEEEKCLEKQ